MKKNLFNNKLLEESSGDKPKYHSSLSDKWLWLIAGLLCIIFVIIVFCLIMTWNQKPPSAIGSRGTEPESKQPEEIALPVVTESLTNNIAREGSNFQADQLIFSQLYQQPTTSWPVEILANKAQSITLPINVKKDVANYYEIKRYYNLEPIISQLNKEGSVLVDNPFGDEKQDFFDFYHSATENHWPLLLTSDVIFYYYQNNIKEVYKAVEAGFYDDLWQISNGLFKIANQRYQAAISQSLKGNDPLIEAYRLNAQYWAVALKLLAPKDNQISNDGITSNSMIFRTGDDQIYKLPVIDEDLRREVDQEVSLIQAASGVKISPLFGYEMDYGLFKPDENYQDGGRLANFLLVSKWLNYSWPLYYREAGCTKCPLDIDDWRVNFLAANVLARDLNSDQEFKNYWAKIYKIISYFSGLRDDLTYIHYIAAQKEILGDQSLEAVARLDEASRNQVLDRLRVAILGNKFLPTNGGWDRQQPDNWPNIGLRVLQDRYWPGQFIDWQTVGPKLDVFVSQQTTTDWQVNQFWSSMEMIKEWLPKILSANSEWVRPAWWKAQHLSLAKFYLLNWQLPADQRRILLPSANSLFQNDGVTENIVSIDTASLPAIDRQIATAKMLQLALVKLQASNLSADQKLMDTINTLEMIRDLAVKQAKGEEWTKEESTAINNFFQSAIVRSGSKQLDPSQKDSPYLQKIKARIDIKMINGQLYMLIGPVIMP